MNEAKAVISLGSNLGNKKNNLDIAINLIGNFSSIITSAHIYFSEPWGYQSNHSFLNMGMMVRTRLEPLDLLKKLKDIDVCILPYTKKITVSGDIGDISNYTSPLKVFDYMVNGKLIICSDLPVLREVLKNNFNSLLIKNFNKVDSWLKIINNVSNNFQKYNQIRYNALIFANKENVIWRTKKILSNDIN